MLAGAALRKTGEGWEFASEAALEDFIWENLQQLLSFTPLKRQYAAKGEFCDILALNESKQLVILELKNAEDRYVINPNGMPYHEKNALEIYIGVFLINHLCPSQFLKVTTMFLTL